MDQIRELMDRIEKDAGELLMLIRELNLDETSMRDIEQVLCFLPGDLHQIEKIVEAK